MTLGITNFMAWPIKDIILRFRAILAGFLNYYSFADNIRSLHWIYFLLHGSLRKTICRKLDIGTKDFLSSYGPNITITIRRSDGKNVQLDFPPPKLRRSPMKFQGSTTKDPLRTKDWVVPTLSSLDQCCSNCGTFQKVEMHHLKHLKTMNARLDSFGRMMARINRKQVPLCRPCHMLVHNVFGEYAGMSLKHFSYLKWNGLPKWV
jgi:hypothetical protein